MSDNSDLLGGTPPPASAAPKRGRPRKAVPETLQTAAPQPPTGVPPELETAPSLLDGLAPAAPSADPDEVVPAGTTDPSAADFPFPNGQTLAEVLANRETISTPETDGSVSAQLPPVSTEYANAMATRIVPGSLQHREYAWQRLKRAGKKL